MSASADTCAHALPGRLGRHCSRLGHHPGRRRNSNTPSPARARCRARSDASGIPGGEGAKRGRGHASILREGPTGASERHTHAPRLHPRRGKPQALPHTYQVMHVRSGFVVLVVAQLYERGVAGVWDVRRMNNAERAGRGRDGTPDQPLAGCRTATSAATAQLQAPMPPPGKQ